MNDDLGQFPTPSQDQPASNPPSTPSAEPNTSSDTSMLEDINAPATNQISNEPFSTPPVVSSAPEVNTPTSTEQQAPTFEETPEEIPSVIQTPSAPETPNEPAIQQPVSEPVAVTPVVATTPEAPAIIVPKGGSSFGSLISLILLLIAGMSIAGVVFLFSQSKQLRQQLSEISQTLESQRTTLTPTPTPTIIEFVTPTPEATPEATPLVTPTASPSATPTPSASISATSTLPLANASTALRVAINHYPNAQMILIKSEDATHPLTAQTKYFFRQDLTTKKYFYVLIVNNNEPELADKAIYVTPDNNIPSLNDLVLGHSTGIDLDEALKVAYGVCSSKLCETATVKAQYIKSGDTLIWQLSFDPADSTKQTIIIQMNALTKAVLYKSPGF